MDKREERLPRWAQDIIKQLRDNLEYANAKLSLALGSEKSAVEIDPYRLEDAGEKPRYLPNHIRIRFHADGGAIDVGLRDGKLEATADGLLSIHPRAGNVVSFTAIQRW